jgi:hypothetical protein
MHINFIGLCGVWAVGLGCYILLGLAFSNLRPRNLRKQPPILFILAACGCFLLGLWAFGVARPYTWIAAAAVWVAGFFVELLRSKSAIHERDDP